MQLLREDVRPSSGSSLVLMDIECSQFDARYHYHPELEITWITSSDGRRLVGDAFESFVPGDLVLIGAGIPHQYQSWRGSPAKAKVLQFHRTVFEGGTLEQAEFRQIVRLLGEAARGLTFSKRTQAVAQRLIVRIFGTRPGPRQLILLIELLHVLSLDKFRKPIASIVFETPVKTKQVERLRRIFQYLDRHWREPIQLAEVAKTASLHPQSLSRFFRQHVGMTFQDYLIELRLSHASRMLIETERTVADIAFTSGFQNLANFNRHFKRIRKTTPSDYRNQCF